MCTLTYIPLKEKILIGSNRDEIPQRSHCELFQMASGGIYPKEPLKGGTWIYASHHRTLVLLNGAFEKHNLKDNYSKSRGLLLLELTELNSPIAHLKSMDLDRIEPFTLVIIEQDSLEEFRWSGEDRYHKKLHSNKAHIWSSATLYSNEAQWKRADLFKKWIQTTKLHADSLWEFHTKKSDDLEDGIVIKRANGLQTISTTQVIMHRNLNTYSFQYYDHLKNELLQV